VLREDHRREATRALLALQTQALANFAVWDKEAGRKLEQFRSHIAERVKPQAAPAQKDLETVFADWGTTPFT
jgi:hypothetical protein